jgi:hypothetical protein
MLPSAASGGGEEPFPIFAGDKDLPPLVEEKVRVRGAQSMR